MLMVSAGAGRSWILLGTGSWLMESVLELLDPCLIECRIHSLTTVVVFSVNRNEAILGVGFRSNNPRSGL